MQCQYGLFQRFYALFDSMKRTEEPHYCQEMHKALMERPTILDPKGITVNVETCYNHQQRFSKELYEQR